MKVVSLDEFLAMEPGTVFQTLDLDGAVATYGILSVKGESFPPDAYRCSEIGIPDLKDQYYVGKPGDRDAEILSDLFVRRDAYPLTFERLGTQHTLTAYKEDIFVVWEDADVYNWAVRMVPVIRSAKKNMPKPPPPDMKKPLHVDEWLDNMHPFMNSTPELNYVHFMLNYFRYDAVTKMAYGSIMAQHKLFVTYEGKTWRVTGASRLGDVYLQSKLDKDHAYDERVPLDFTKLTNWRAQP
jgi:hypothetical protein